MSRFLTLLLIPLVTGHRFLLSDDAASPVQKTIREFEEELHLNVSKWSSSKVMLPPVTPDENGVVGPVHVKVNFYVRDVTLKEVDKDLYEWTLDLTFRQKWNDSRLEYDASHYPDFKYLDISNPGSLKSIWKPDTFFPGAYAGDFHFVMTPNVLLWVYPDGKVLYSLRITLKLRCHAVKLGAFGNTVDCPLRLASYGKTSDKLDYEWDEGLVEIGEDVYIPHYSLDTVSTSKSSGKTKVGEWSSLKADFHFTYQG